MNLQSVNPRSSLDYHQLISDPTDRDALLREVRDFKGDDCGALVFRPRRALAKKHRREGATWTGVDVDGAAFLPWSLMRCAEAAKVMGLSRIQVICDMPSWDILESTAAVVRLVMKIAIEHIPEDYSSSF